MRFFGGSLLKGHAKLARPLSTKEPIHLIMKSKQAIGSRSMLRSYNVKKIDSIISKQAKLSGITIYQLVNVGNHLHLVIRITNLFFYDRFIRATTGIIARHVTKQQRRNGLKFLSQTELKARTRAQSQSPVGAERFWDARPFTRLIAWGRDYQHIKNYMDKNKSQANLRQYFIAWGFDTTDAVNIQYLNTG
ncbi:MAG: hypothetical protein A2Z20_01400 [Bdellovibrionales bacterium RBG_16_40_8]|nr:MAG: hypothetical protein A2Z20_01400 [Bdellovibrionales bacterium RBG_16_40_8]